MRTSFIILLALLTLSPLCRADEKADTPLASALAQYVKIQAALAGDSLVGVPEAAAAISAAVKASASKLPASLATEAETVAKAHDLKAARDAFKSLSATLITAAAETKSGRYFEAYCPMAAASWIQVGRHIANPYYGASMLTCGEVRREL